MLSLNLFLDQSVFLAMYAVPLILRQQFIAHKKKRTKISIAASRDAFILLLEVIERIFD